MPQTEHRAGNRLMDRPEYASKPFPLTSPPEATVFDAVAKMSEKNYGSVIVIDTDRRGDGTGHHEQTCPQGSRPENHPA